MSIWYEASAGLIRTLYDRRISGPPVLDLASRFPAAHHFVDAWEEIRDEALQVANTLREVPRFHELMPSQADISANDERDWRMLVLKAYGVAIQQNMARCPKLASLVNSAPDVLSATLSFLSPGKHIPRHRGPFRGVIRFYLGLSVPTGADGRPDVMLIINDVEHRIANGECLLWDDTFPHEVWNRSNQVRIALLLDIRRHGMPPDMALLSRLLIGFAGAAIRVRRNTLMAGN